jgi:flagellar motor switch protein FliG
MSATSKFDLSGPRKAAILMVVLGDRAAKELCDRLPQDALQILADEISSMGAIPEEVAAAVLQEYQIQTLDQDAMMRRSKSKESHG